MKKRLFTTLALVCGITLVCLAVAANLTGKWSGALKTPNGDYPINYTFKADGDKLTGSAESKEGSTPITDGKINGNDFSFALEYNGATLKNTGKFYGDSITVDIDYNGTMLHGNLKRAEDKK